MPNNPPLPPPPGPPQDDRADDDTQLMNRGVPTDTVPNWDRFSYAPPPEEAPPTQGWYAGPPPQHGKPKRSRKKVVVYCLLGVVVFFVLMSVIGVLAGTDKPKPAAASSPVSTASATHHAKPKPAVTSCNSKVSSWANSTGRTDLRDLSAAVLAMGSDDGTIRDDILNSGTVASADNNQLMQDTARVDGVALRMKLKDPQPPSCVSHLRRDYTALASDAEASGVDQLLMGGAINQSNWAMASAYLTLSIDSLNKATAAAGLVKQDIDATGSSV